MLTEFRNEPFTDYSQKANEDAMRAAIKKVRSEFGKTYPLIIDGKEIKTDDLMVSTNPGDPNEVVGKFSKASVKEAEQQWKPQQSIRIMEECSAG